MKLLALLGVVALTTLANGQQIVMLSAEPVSDPPPVHGTNQMTIASDDYVKLITLWPVPLEEAYVRVERTDGVLVEEFTHDDIQNSAKKDIRMFPGPLVIRLINGDVQDTAHLVLEITPGPYPPGKSAVIGERDGPMKCTLEESTDLVNWTQSTSGATHSLTNANAKKFFRVKLEQDVDNMRTGS